MQIVEKSRRREYSAWYGKVVDRVVYFIIAEEMRSENIAKNLD